MSNHHLQSFINYLVITKNINSSNTIFILQKEIYSTKTLILKSDQVSLEKIQEFIIEKTNTHYDDVDKKHLLQIYKNMELLPLYSQLHNLHDYLIMKRNSILYKECGKSLADYILKDILFETY